MMMLILFVNIYAKLRRAEVFILDNRTGVCFASRNANEVAHVLAHFGTDCTQMNSDSCDAEGSDNDDDDEGNDGYDDGIDDNHQEELNTSPAKSNVQDAMPSWKRTSMNQPKQSPFEKLTTDLCTIR